jgi:hypothetical protein
VTDGRIAEQWDQADVLGLLQQLGGVPPNRARRPGADHDMHSTGAHGGCTMAKLIYVMPTSLDGYIGG